MSTALHPLAAYMEPTTADDDAKQCGVAACRALPEAACHACGDPLCEDHSHYCTSCNELHCRPCLRFVDDERICRRDWAAYIEEQALVIEFENARAAERKQMRAS